MIIIFLFVERLLYPSRLYTLILLKKQFEYKSVLYILLNSLTLFIMDATNHRRVALITGITGQVSIFKIKTMINFFGEDNLIIAFVLK